MGADLVIPEWVPEAVKAMATKTSLGQLRKRGEAAGPLGLSPTAYRLLTDCRMKRVWSTLRNEHLKFQRTQQDSREPLATAAPACEDVWPPRNDAVRLDANVRAKFHNLEQLSTWGIQDYGIPLEDQACAALFAFIAMEFCVEREVWTRERSDKLAQKFDTAIEVCRIIVAERPMFGDDMSEAALTIIPALQGYSCSLKETGKINDRVSDDAAPYFLVRSSRERGDDHVRAQTISVGMATIRIFGTPLYGSVKTVLRVALSLKDKEVTDARVKNWLKDRQSTEGCNNNPL